MNTHLHQPQVETSNTLYQEPAAGMHYYIKRNKMSYIFKTPNPFLSTGNFDQITAVRIATAMANEKHMSCGNFMTSTKAEDWSKVPDEFKPSKFAGDGLTHSQHNVKYNIGSDDNIQYPKRSGNRVNQRMRSHEEMEDYSYHPTGSGNTGRQVRPIGEDSPPKAKPAINRLSSFYYKDQSNNDRQQQIVAKPVNKDDSDDDGSANEYEFASEEENEFKSHLRENKPLEHSINQTAQIIKMGDVFDDLKDKCLSQLLSKKTNRRLDQSAIVCDEEIDMDEYYTPHQIFEMSMESKESSIKVQVYMKLLNPQELNLVAHYLCTHVNYLIMDKFGNYVVQFLTDIHIPSRKYISDLSLNNFVKFAENEYGSRIMQKLASISPEFCYRALNQFYNYFDRLIKNITGSILLSKLISSAQSEEEYSFCVHVLEQNQEYLRKTYFNRMLATLVGVCSLDMLSQVVYYMRNHTWILMNDKFGNYVLQIVAERGDHDGTMMIKHACMKNATVILTRKYPKFLLIKIVEMEKDNDFCDRMMESLISMDDNSIWQILSKRDSAMLLVLIMSKQRSFNIGPNADRLLQLLAKHHREVISHSNILLTLGSELIEGIRKVSSAASETDDPTESVFKLPHNLLGNY